MGPSVWMFFMTVAAALAVIGGMAGAMLFEVYLRYFGDDNEP